MQSETGFPSSHQLKSYVAYKCRLKLAARAVLSADAGLLVIIIIRPHRSTTYVDAAYCYLPSSVVCRSVCLSVALSVCHSSEP